jgi:hypothetical protein
VLARSFNNLSYNYSALNASVPLIQPKLEINQPGDKYEQEADEMADKVMRKPGPTTNQLSSGANTIQRKCAHCEEEEKKKKIQRKENGDGRVHVSDNLSSYVNNLGNSGQPLSKEERNFFEPRFGYDFSKVKIHNDAPAANSATSINAQAYTYGNNIVFNNGKYSPATNSGKRLLGHELTHVVQQGKGVSRKIQRSPGSPAGGCGVCYGSPKLAGIAAHILIQEGLKAALGGNVVQAETLVPSPGDESGRLDIAISTGGDSIMIAEIKPNNPNGKAQWIKDIKHYSKQLRALGMKVTTLDWVPKIPVLPFPTLGSGPSCPSFQSLSISAEPSAPGVILYDCNPDFKELIKKCKCNPFKKNKKEGEKEKTSEK